MTSIEDQKTAKAKLDYNRIKTGETVYYNEKPHMRDESEHEVLHTSADGSEIKSYQCEHCQKTFLTMSQLTSHRWQHTRPFTCDFCREKFPSKGKLGFFLLTTAGLCRLSKNFKTSNSLRSISGINSSLFA